MKSYNPATGKLIWEQPILSYLEIEQKIAAAKKRFSASLEERIQLLKNYQTYLTQEKDSLALLISEETGKPLWDSKTEVAAMIGKIPISIEAFQDRCKRKEQEIDGGKLITEFRPYGTVAVFGPFNFPCHLPNGHIVPALLAGNRVIFKPSELTPACGEWIEKALLLSGFPKHAFQVIQGGPDVGQAIVSSPDINGIFFTGSAFTGQLLLEQCVKAPDKILALEMGGNNPLVISHVHDLKKAVEIVIKSAYLTTGQRCSSARRLILTPDCDKNFLPELVEQIKAIKIGSYPEDPFMGPLIDLNAMNKLLKAQENLIQLGAKELISMKQLYPDLPFVSPALIDATPVANLPDVEYFGPFLQVIHANSFENALKIANSTSFGLTAGLLSESEDEWNQFYSTIRAGVINWNSPITGASSKAPFGGIGKSGNHRPSAYLAADYCSYPVASMQSTRIIQ